ncbi:hypothetical protein ABW21_db0203090 [Orbilia brochopaga]|nr:hypothetical protein ABW21_db0203090 [Drechslerella brochopaga]
MRLGCRVPRIRLRLLMWYGLFPVQTRRDPPASQCIWEGQPLFIRIALRMHQTTAGRGVAFEIVPPRGPSVLQPIRRWHGSDPVGSVEPECGNGRTICLHVGVCMHSVQVLQQLTAGYVLLVKGQYRRRLSWSP